MTEAASDDDEVRPTSIQTVGFFLLQNGGRMSDTLDRLRSEIHEIDDAIVELLRQRCRMALKIGVEKAKRSLPMHDRAREEDVMSRILRLPAGPIESKRLEFLFRSIISDCRALQNRAYTESQGE